MKRIFSLLAALMCLSVSSVWAQDATPTRKFSISDTPTPAAELTSGYYVLKIACKSKVGYAYVCKNANIATATEKCYGINYQDGLQLDTIGTHNSLAYLWYIGTTPDSKMLCIQNAGDASYFPKQSNHNNYDMKEVRTLANAAAFRYTQVYGDLGVMLYQTNEKMNGGIPYVHANDSNNPNLFTMSCWENFSATDGSGSNCFFTFYKVNVEDDFTSNATPAIPIYKYKQQIDGVDTNVKTETENNVIVMKVGEAPIANNPFSYSSVLYDVTYPVSVASNTEEITVNFVKKTSSTIGLDTYHRLNIARSTQLAVTKNGNISTKYCTKNFLANYLSSYWKFVQDGLQVKMVNCDGKYLKLTSVPTEYTEGKCKGAVQYVDNASDATNLYLCEKPSNSAYTGNGGFILKVGDSSNNVAIGDHQNRKLCAWKNSGAFIDEGSCFVVADNVDLHGATSILLPRLFNDKMTQAEISDNILRVADNASIELANTALSKVHENITPGELIDAYNLAYKAKIDENAYYRIKSQGTSNNEATAKRYPSSEAIVTNTEGVLQAGATRTITRKAASDNMVAQLWQFKDAGDGNYFIQNANTGCRWAATEGNIDMPTMDNSGNAGHYSIDAIPVGGQTFSEGSISSVNDGKSNFLITLHLQDLHIINAHGGLNDFDILKEDASNATPCNDPGNYWQIEKVENFDVTISNAKYATVGYPFPVQVTNTNVKVYYATKAANGILKLTEATDNIIPANEGAILYCESGATNANMKILSSTESTFADNKLTATTAKRDGFTTLTTYGLSNKDGVVCFRKNSDTNVPANKAYLDARNYTSASGSAQQLLFSFDNVVEGIDNVVKAQNANKVYYDLQGRRVLYPAHGIFVTENGEKVFIK